MLIGPSHSDNVEWLSSTEIANSVCERRDEYCSSPFRGAAATIVPRGDAVARVTCRDLNPLGRVKAQRQSTFCRVDMSSTQTPTCPSDSTLWITYCFPASARKVTSGSATELNCFHCSLKRCRPGRT